jgi:hypothetical protein
MPRENLNLWDEGMEVLSSEEIEVREGRFPLHYVRASDDTEALLPLCETELKADCYNLEEVIKERLEHIGLHPRFATRKGHKFLMSVFPVHKELTKRFGRENVGLVVLLNGCEPGEGTHAIEEMQAKQGSTLQVLYRISGATKKKVEDAL